MDAAGFMQKFIPEPNTGCWLWLGAIDAGGYGKEYFNRKNTYAHRVSYEIAGGHIPEGLELDHLCRVRCCVNPEHLEPVTRVENQRRGMRARGVPRRVDATHCRHGHDLSIVGRSSRFACMECRRVHRRDYRERQKHA